MKKATEVLDNEAEVLGFLRTQYPIFHQSNIFFRDIQYGIRTMLERKGVRVGYTDAERLARDFTDRLEKKKMLVRIDGQSWVVRNEEFRTEPVTRQPPAKPAAPKPAAGGSPGALPPLKSAAPAGGGLPPLKSSAPASGGKPASLPPLKSSAPAGGKSASAAPASPTKEPAAGQNASEQKKETASAKAPASGSGGLPPITSSVPAGKK